MGARTRAVWRTDSFSSYPANTRAVPGGRSSTGDSAIDTTESPCPGGSALVRTQVTEVGQDVGRCQGLGAGALSNGAIRADLSDQRLKDRRRCLSR